MNVALALEVASIDHISEVNMVGPRPRCTAGQAVRFGGVGADPPLPPAAPAGVHHDRVPAPELEGQQALLQPHQ